MTERKGENKMRYYLAVDIGASSGRHILSHKEGGKLVLEEIYRFENGLEERNGHQCWNLEALFSHILKGLKACKAAGKIPETMGVDTWAVDFVLLDKENRVLGDTVAYRDGRTSGMDRVAERILSFKELYDRTGIQKQPFNSVYQLLAIQKEHPEYLEQAESFLMLPDYFHLLLTGVKKSEYTNATSTALVGAQSKTWDRELLSMLGLPEKPFAELTLPGNRVGNFLPEIQEEVGFDCTVLLPATHDTGSAFLAVPARDENAVYLSSGTWSLLGVENLFAIVSESGRAANFTNEGGYAYRYRFLKNIMGLWMIQSIRRDLGKKYSYAELENLAAEAKDFPSLVNVNDESFLAPQNMCEAVKDYCEKTAQPVPQTVGELMHCVYRSLARCYADAIHELEGITGKRYTSINIVGGGSKDGTLNSLTARYTGLPVSAGPSEATALGNLLVQMISAGEYADLSAARAAVRESFAVKDYFPENEH